MHRVVLMNLSVYSAETVLTQIGHVKDTILLMILYVHWYTIRVEVLYSS